MVMLRTFATIDNMTWGGWGGKLGWMSVGFWNQSDLFILAKGLCDQWWGGTCWFGWWPPRLERETGGHAVAFSCMLASPYRGG
jgi:hypothetical protein